MSTLSIPIPPRLEEALAMLIKGGYGSNKAEIVRRALDRFIEDEAVFAVIRAEQEVAEGKVLRGDLRKLIKRT